MVIATFGPTTAWVGMQITREGDAFVLEGHGPISADDIMEYDRQGHLVWVNDGTRAWVGSKVKGSPVSKAAATTTTAPTTSEARGATGVGTQPSSHKPSYLKRALLLAIIVLVVINVVLILVISGVVHGP